MAPERADVLSSLAEALTFEASGVVTQPARELFAAALARDAKNPGARFYLGLADAQGGDAPAALKRWLDLEADSPEGAPWLETLAREIERVSKQAGIDPRSIRPDRKERTAGESGMPGTGGPGYKLKAEFNAKSHVRGVISMARSAHPDSAGSQFFICHGDAKFLDRQYTAFGQVIKGDEVLEQLANVPTKAGGGGEKSTPIDRVALESVKIVVQS